MKPQELRIGNTIMCQCRGEHKPYTIKSIWYNDEEKLYYVELDNGFQCNINGITPIPITDELLLKCGFEQCGYLFKTLFIEMYEVTNGWHLHIDNERFETALSITTKYVHQLQNAYYLATDKELEIEL